MRRRNFIAGLATAAVASGCRSLMPESSNTHAKVMGAGTGAAPLPRQRSGVNLEHAVELKGLTLRLGKPWVAAETDRGHCWFPDLLRFQSGALMLTHSLNMDSTTNYANSTAVLISEDGGESFPFRYDVNGFSGSGGTPRIALPDGRIAGTDYTVYPVSPDHQTLFQCARWEFLEGGTRYCVEPLGASLHGFPRAVQPADNPTRMRQARVWWCGDIVEVDGGWLSTLSMRFAGDPKDSTIVVYSTDQGRNWEYRGLVADGRTLPAATEEGFNECSMTRLRTGELMCVSRMGAGIQQKLARAYSGDEGRTWSAIDRLPAYSVAPQVTVLHGGTLLLTTGRPGLWAWLSTDERGTEWQGFDLMRHHNALVAEELRIAADPAVSPHLHQTTAYTAIVEVAPNRVLIVYDRTANGWSPITEGCGAKSQVFLVEMQIERT